jgi:hypothetical protein
MLDADLPQFCNPMDRGETLSRLRKTLLMNACYRVKRAAYERISV